MKILFAIALMLLIIETALTAIIVPFNHMIIFYVIYNLAIIGLLWFSFFFYRRSILSVKTLKKVLTQRSSEPIVQQLQNQIQSYIDEKNLMLSALAHDIKTPLTEAFLHLELLQDESVAEPIKKNLNKINQIVTSSLTYAKHPDQIKTTSVDVVSLIESMIEHYQSSSFTVNFTSSVEQCDAFIELELFKRMISNLIENAQKYATHITITLEYHAPKLFLTFEDNGPGVPNQFLHLLGIPYFRVDQARSSNTGGTGLGLAIIKKIVELHQGEITFCNVDAGGFRASIILNTDKLEKLHS